MLQLWKIAPKSIFFEFSLLIFDFREIGQRLKIHKNDFFEGNVIFKKFNISKIDFNTKSQSRFFSEKNKISYKKVCFPLKLSISQQTLYRWLLKRN